MKRNQHQAGGNVSRRAQSKQARKSTVATQRETTPARQSAPQPQPQTNGAAPTVLRPNYKIIVDHCLATLPAGKEQLHRCLLALGDMLTPIERQDAAAAADFRARRYNEARRDMEAALESNNALLYLLSFYFERAGDDGKPADHIAAGVIELSSHCTTSLERCSNELEELAGECLGLREKCGAR